MQIEPTPIAAASLAAQDARDVQDMRDVQREASAGETAIDAFSFPEPMSYEDLLPYLLLPMAAAY
jgi:hypothetical protein